MVGGQFTATNGDPVKLVDFIKGDFTAREWDGDGEWLAKSPVVLLWDTELGDYNWYYYQTEAGYEEDPSADGWVDGQTFTCEDVEINPGAGFWFADFNTDADSGTISLTFAGQIPGDETGYTLVSEGMAYNLLANPLPIDTLLNSDKVSFSGITAVDWDGDGEWLATSPVVLIYDQEIGDFVWYYYQTEAGGEEDPTADGWVDGQTFYAGEEAVLGVNKGWWFRNPEGNAVQIHFDL